MIVFDFKTFCSLNENKVSEEPFKLYNKLKVLFEPNYLVDRPSGKYGENINITFNDKIKYEDISKIIDDAGWYVNDHSFDYKSIYISPKYSVLKVDKVPASLYHVSPSYNDENILKNGLVSKNDNVKVKYPNRIYLSSDADIAIKLAKELNQYKRNRTDIWSLFKINSKNIKKDDFYFDDSVAYGKCYFYQENDIKPEDIKFIKHFEL